MVSGIFRETLWNQTIPDALRGRLAGVELLSYGVGPPAGQLRSGVVASLAGTRSRSSPGDWPAWVPSHWYAGCFPGSLGTNLSPHDPQPDPDMGGARRRRVPPGTRAEGSGSACSYPGKRSECGYGSKMMPM